jgi:hypothetical protein
MSALHPKADIRCRDRHVRFVPKADIASASVKHFVGALLQEHRHVQPKPLRGLKIDRHHELRR